MYSANEMAELAAGLRRVLGAIEGGSLAADAGTIARLEGAAAAISVDTIGAVRPVIDFGPLDTRQSRSSFQGLGRVHGASHL
jgi:hypothetical protein